MRLEPLRPGTSWDITIDPEPYVDEKSTIRVAAQVRWSRASDALGYHVCGLHIRAMASKDSAALEYLYDHLEADEEA